MHRTFVSYISWPGHLIFTVYVLVWNILSLHDYIQHRVSFTRILPNRMKRYFEFNWSTFLKKVKFAEINITKFLFLEFIYLSGISIKWIWGLQNTYSNKNFLPVSEYILTVKSIHYMKGLHLPRTIFIFEFRIMQNDQIPHDFEAAGTPKILFVDLVNTRPHYT